MPSIRLLDAIRLDPGLQRDISPLRTSTWLATQISSSRLWQRDPRPLHDSTCILGCVYPAHDSPPAVNAVLKEMTLGGRSIYRWVETRPQESRLAGVAGTECNSLL